MTPLSHLEPTALAEFEFRAPLGAGTMARVFEAVHKPSGRAVAIKVLNPAAEDSKELRERLAREAVVLASVASPHVNRLVGYGWDSDRPFLVLERLEGETLGDLLRRDGRLPPARLVHWVEQLLLGLADCHDAHVVHRDIKPTNIYLHRSAPDREPAVKLIDFGVARLNEIAESPVTLTSTHHLIGSMAYMAPEQLENPKGAGPRADLYAAAVVLFRCFSGRLPFVGPTFEVLTKLKFRATAPLLSSLPGVLPNDLLDAFLARSLSRDPQARFSGAREMLEEWWRVVAALGHRDPGARSPGAGVVFDEDEWVNTVAEGLSKAPPSSDSLHAARIRRSESSYPTDPEVDRPTERQIPAAPKRTEPPEE